MCRALSSSLHFKLSVKPHVDSSHCDSSCSPFETCRRGEILFRDLSRAISNWEADNTFYFYGRSKCGEEAARLVAPLFRPSGVKYGKEEWKMIPSINCLSDEVCAGMCRPNGQFSDTLHPPSVVQIPFSFFSASERINTEEGRPVHANKKNILAVKEPNGHKSSISVFHRISLQSRR